MIAIRVGLGLGKKKGSTVREKFKTVTAPYHHIVHKWSDIVVQGLTKCQIRGRQMGRGNDTY